MQNLSEELISQTEKRLDSVTTEVQLSFSGLAGPQLNWKPNPGKWSIAEVLDHLMVSNATYLPQFSSIAANTYHPALYRRMHFIARFIGKQMIKDLGPERRKAFKNPALFAPSTGNLPENIVARFVAHQDELKRHISALRGKPLQEIVIASPVTPVIIYTVADTLRILAGHEERHLLQATDVKSHPNFPV